MDVCLRAAGASDDLQHSVDYGAVYMCDLAVPHSPRDPPFRLGIRWESWKRQFTGYLVPWLVCPCCARCACRLVKKVVEGQRRQLIEAVAEDIAREVLQHSAKIGGVAVTVKKPHVAVPGQVDYLGAAPLRSDAPARTAIVCTRGRFVCC